MADIKQQRSVVGGIPGTNPMNLTCQPVQTSEADAKTKYTIVMNGDGPAAPPNNTWQTVFVSTDAYEVKSQDGTIDFTIAAGGLGIYSK